MKADRSKVFVSYSREDEELVRPVAQLVQVGEAEVFWDKHIPPGRQWTEVIESQVRDSDSVIVLWCCHALASEWVSKEVAWARLDPRRPIAPLLLCDHPVHTELSRYQWIDLRELIDHHCYVAPEPKMPVVDPRDLRVVSGSEFLATQGGLSSAEIADLREGPDSEVIGSALHAVVKMLQASAPRVADRGEELVAG